VQRVSPDPLSDDDLMSSFEENATDTERVSPEVEQLRGLVSLAQEQEAGTIWR
jgi:hypothetical protein